MRTPDPVAPLYPPDQMAQMQLGPKGPKIAMILLLGPEEREFRLTEAQVRRHEQGSVGLIKFG